MFLNPTNLGARPKAYPIPLGWGGRAQFDFRPALRLWFFALV